MRRDIQCKFTKLGCPRNTNTWKLPDLVRRLDKSKTCLPQTHCFPSVLPWHIRQIPGWIWPDTAGRKPQRMWTYGVTFKSIPASISSPLSHPLNLHRTDPSSWPCRRRKYLDSSPSWNFCSCSNYCSCFVLMLPADPLTRTSELQKKIRYGSESTVGGA